MKVYTSLDRFSSSTRIGSVGRVGVIVMTESRKKIQSQKKKREIKIT